MSETARETWITGVGIVSSLGEGLEAHWQALNEGRLVFDDSYSPPFIVHRVPPIDFDKQIPKKGDQRQMEAWQRIGTYAAGLALDDAKIKGDSERLSTMDLIVAAGGGERDAAVDSAILSGLPKAANPAAFLNERLTSDLRPTLFLAQLSNLLAGNISIVHGVTGSSRTFMGEESSGVDAVRIALARIAAGQSEIGLVGGSYNADRKEQLFFLGFGSFNLEGAIRPVWERGPKGGFAIGSLGAFLVLEPREHAESRGAKALARLTLVASEHTRREPGAVTDALERMWARCAPKLEAGHYAVISGATGAEPATSEEREFFARHPDIPVRATGAHFGHGVEAQFVMNIALAVGAIQRGTLFPPLGDAGVEKPFAGTLRQAVVTSIGHWRGEGLALVEAVN
ncbi:MAG: beta-ketoacyl-ACP synthase [Variibacter sp.]